MKESNFDFLDMKQSILDLLVSRSSLFNDVAARPGRDPGTGPACRRWSLFENQNSKFHLPSTSQYRQLGSFSLSTQHVYFSTLIVWCWLQSVYNPRIADNFEHIKPLCLLSSNKYVLVILFALKSISCFMGIVKLRSKFDVSNTISTIFMFFDSIRLTPPVLSRFGQ